MENSAKPRILYIDDYSSSCQLIDMLLYIKKCKYDFSIANSPARALEMIDGGEHFDLYILEYKLPEMNGIKLCRKIRQADQKTPILFFTSNDRDCSREKSLSAGANEYLQKPAALDHLTETIKRLLAETNRDLASQAVASQKYKPYISHRNSQFL